MIYIIHQYLYIFNSKIDENKGVRNKMIIIGIDPGYAIVGIGVLSMSETSSERLNTTQSQHLQECRLSNV